jgi:hypothetical protein
VAFARHYRFSARGSCSFGDLGLIGGDNAPVGDVHGADTLPHAGYKGSAAEESKWLLRESNRGEARRDYNQRPHPPPEIARLDAKVTPPI